MKLKYYCCCCYFVAVFILSEISFESDCKRLFQNKQNKKRLKLASRRNQKMDSSTALEEIISFLLQRQVQGKSTPMAKRPKHRTHKIGSLTAKSILGKLRAGETLFETEVRPENKLVSSTAYQTLLKDLITFWLPKLLEAKTHLGYGSMKERKSYNGENGLTTSRTKNRLSQLGESKRLSSHRKSFKNKVPTRLMDLSTNENIDLVELMYILLANHNRGIHHLQVNKFERSQNWRTLQSSLMVDKLKRQKRQLPIVAAIAVDLFLGIVRFINYCIKYGCSSQNDVEDDMSIQDVLSDLLQSLNLEHLNAFNAENVSTMDNFNFLVDILKSLLDRQIQNHPSEVVSSFKKETQTSCKLTMGNRTNYMIESTVSVSRGLFHKLYGSVSYGFVVTAKF